MSQSTETEVGAPLRGPIITTARGPRLLLLLVIVSAIGMSFAILYAGLTREAVGALVVALTVVLLLGGVHVAVAIFIPAILGLLRLGSANALFGLLENLPFDSTASWQLSVIPFFVLMGMALWRSGISARAFEAARQWFGMVPGGLAISTVVTGGGLAAASGSTIGIAYALGRVSLPEMLRARYDTGVAIGAVSIAGVVGQIIPPSIMLVIYAGVAQTPIGQQLLAGVVPGVLIVVAVSLMLLRALANKDLAPPISMAGVTWSTRFRALGGAVPLFVIMIVVIGGIMGGIFTATEAGAVGAVVGLIIGAALLPPGGGARGILTYLRETVVGTVYAVAPIFLLIIGVHLLTRVVTLSQVAQSLAGLVADLDVSTLTFLLLLIPFFIFLGCFLDTLAILLITVPVLLPTLRLMEVDLVWFGIFVVILAEMALMTPPVGMLVYIVHRLAQSVAPAGTKVSLGAAFRGVGWYLIPVLAVVVAIIFFPELATGLAKAGGD